MAKEGDECHPPPPPQYVFPVFLLGMGRDFIPNKIFSCGLILGTFVHEKIFQIGPTVLALKLDKERVLGVATTPISFSPIFLTMKMTFNLNKFWFGIR